MRTIQYKTKENQNHENKKTDFPDKKENLFRRTFSKQNCYPSQIKFVNKIFFAENRQTFEILPQSPKDFFKNSSNSKDQLSHLNLS